jgi:hypothetical protein
MLDQSIQSDNDCAVIVRATNKQDSDTFVVMKEAIKCSLAECIILHKRLNMFSNVYSTDVHLFGSPNSMDGAKFRGDSTVICLQSFRITLPSFVSIRTSNLLKIVKYASTILNHVLVHPHLTTNSNQVLVLPHLLTDPYRHKKTRQHDCHHPTTKYITHSDHQHPPASKSRKKKF